MAAQRSLPELLAAGPVVLDGGLATELEARGFELADELWSARLLADAPEAIEAVHVAYLRAGAQVITTASYQASVEGFARAGRGIEEAEALLRRAVGLAQRARDGAGSRAALVAASVGPYGAMLAGGQEYTGDYGEATLAEVEAFHERRLRVLLEAEPDCIACETIPRADEAACLARLLDRLEAPAAWVALQCRDGRTLAHGEPIEEGVAAAATSPRVVAVGVNCTAPEHLDELLARARAATDLPLVAYPNRGQGWDGEARGWAGEGSAPRLADAAGAWTAAGATLVGGCCGLGPEAIRELADGLGAGAAHGTP